MAMTLPGRIHLAHLPTPLAPLRRLPGLPAPPHGPTIWIKRDDLTGSALSGNKVRKLEFTIAEALKQNADTLITCGGIQSNHCRATAIAGAQLGLKVHLILRGEPTDDPDGNLFLDYASGAEVSFYSVKEFKTRLDEIYEEIAEQYRQKGNRPYKIPMGASDEVGAWGYVAACEELKEDFVRHGIEPEHIVCATGSGGTQAGLTAGSQLFDLGATVWGINVCDNEDYFLHKIRSDLGKWRERYQVAEEIDPAAIHVIDGYVGPGYARAAPEIFETIARLARYEGIILDPVYTGKAFHGLLSEIAAGRFDGVHDIVFIHTGGIYGLLAQRNQMPKDLLMPGGPPAR